MLLNDKNYVLRDWPYSGPAHLPVLRVGITDSQWIKTIDWKNVNFFNEI